MAIRAEFHIVGDALASLGRKIGLSNDDFAVFDQVRNKALAGPVRVE